MVGKGFLASGFHLFHLVIKEEINENGVDVGVWMSSHDFPPNELYTPYAACCSSCQFHVDTPDGH